MAEQNERKGSACRDRSTRADAREAFDELTEVIWRLRQPDGCPWDRVQTHESIAQNMIEEAYEALGCIEEHDDAHLREELGDVLMQVMLHAQIAADAHEFTIADVVRELSAKLIRRHPHVFGGDRAAADAGAVLDIWDQVKKDTVEDVWEQVASERAEFLAEAPGSAERELEFGDMLFALVNVARKEGIDAERALRASTAKFRRRWRAVEAAARDRGVAVEELSTAELNVLWDAVKTQEHAAMSTTIAADAKGA